MDYNIRSLTFSGNGHFETQGFLDLPADVVYIIFSQSGCKELGRLMQVSQSYYQVANLPIVWKMTLLKESPNLLKAYPSLNILPAKKIAWKKIYLEEVHLDMNQWMGHDTFKIAAAINRSDGIKFEKKEISLNLSSDKLSLKIFKKIAINHMDLPLTSRELDVVLCNRIIGQEDTVILKEIKISDPDCPRRTFKEFVGEEKPFIFFSKKQMQTNTLPEEWIIQEKHTFPDTKKKKKDNCLIM